MIGVYTQNSDRPAVSEFFELFKTPWEFYRPEGKYDVLICCDSEAPSNSAKLVVIYGAEERVGDREGGIANPMAASNALLSYNGVNIPVYGNCRTFGQPRTCLLTDEFTGQSAAFEVDSGRQKVVRVGFHLFREILHLLKRGQPIGYASIPTLELHIAFLRDAILRCSIPLIEIPPVPDGHPIIACLTHDVDHVGVRNHRFDHTMLGFLYRATIGSVVDFCRGSMSAKQLATNWTAVLSLPLVHLGVAKDFWYQFERYVEIEKGLTSTFFVIPYKNDSGQGPSHSRSPMRATRYDVGDITKDIRGLEIAGREIGLHGIDAWRDGKKGREERARISDVTRASEIGVRMHWLFFDEKSPAVLEEAGFSYDSTVGYNETVGFRAGTTQAFKPLDVARMLELPMHIMDTAMFFRDRMNLSFKEAGAVVKRLVENAIRFGGVLTVNWHDRSIAPERLWGEFYVKLLDDLKSERAWFPTAAQAVAWFRKRRSVAFGECSQENGEFKVKLTIDSDDSVCGLRIRIHRANGAERAGMAKSNAGNDYVDVAFNRDCDLRIPA